MTRAVRSEKALQLFIEKLNHQVDFFLLDLLLLYVRGDHIEVTRDAFKLIDNFKCRLRQHVHVLLELLQLAELGSLRHDAG